MHSPFSNPAVSQQGYETLPGQGVKDKTYNLMSFLSASKQRLILSVLIILVASSIRSEVLTVRAQSAPPLVRLVLFYSPTCGHCQQVIQETLLPLIEQYGEQLQVIGVDTSQPQGFALYDSARNMFNPEIRGVPFLVIGNEYLSGSVDIPQKLPGKIEMYMAQGGVDWPDIPGLQDAIHASETAQAPASTTPASPAASLPTPTSDSVIFEPVPPPDAIFSLPNDTELTAWQRVLLDPLGNGIAIAVLLVMVTIFLGAILTYRQIPTPPMPGFSQTLILILCLVGLSIAGYLAYVETTQTTAICGPVGDCNTVQQSEYARLFGILPIGVLGGIGYLSILFSWVMARTQASKIANSARLTMSILSTFGFIFSIYLTFLEPFVIGATCAWCIASAVIMTALFILTLTDGKTAYRRIMSSLFPGRHYSA